jgi:hypothetical protein
MKRGFDKRGQQTMGMPFGIIFSIILIVVFIVIAFIAVRSFLDLGRCAEVGQFYEGFQNEVDNVWKSQESEKSYDLDLPAGIDEICFANFSMSITNSLIYEEVSLFEFDDVNAVLLPYQKACDMAGKNIKHLDVSKIVVNENPKCFSAGEIVLKKGFYDKYAFIE